MANRPLFELVSFELCPYVQRSVITLLHKKIAFKLTYIDLESTPPWFDQISPLGKVPVLLVRVREVAEPRVLFESAVINEYLDEITPPLITLKDPLKKAFERSWIEVGAELLGILFSMMVSKDVKKAEEYQNELWEVLKHVEAILPGGSFFRGDQFSLVDAAFAPLFMRLMLFKSLKEDNTWRPFPKTRQWADALLQLPEVRDSVSPDFTKKFAAFLKEHGSVLASQVTY